MSILHKNITDPDIHEPKGVSSAQAGTVYVANGGGSGSWKALEKYAEIYFSADKTIPINAASDVSLETNTDYIKIGSVWVGGLKAGANYDTTEGALVITQAGVYELSFWATHHVSGSTNRNIAFKYAVNGVLSDRKVGSSSSFNGQLSNVSASGIVSLNVGDKVSLYVACTGTVDIVLTDATLKIKGV